MSNETTKLLTECYRLLGEALELMDERRDLKKRITVEKNALRGYLPLLAKLHETDNEHRRLKQRLADIERRVNRLHRLGLI